ncbi:MAG: ABC transporter ATP-binding protein [Lachnospiraceae bacterium]|nr:ABC transporter ATP-binding protein [Lachnospiraceae bacterium]
MIEVRNLCMSYGKKEVLKDISFEIQDGKTVGLVGAKGAGKSTMMNILTGYLTPVSGTVLINGINLIKQPVKAKKLIGYLPEIPPIYKEMKVYEYLSFGAELKGIREYKTESARVLELLHLEEERCDFIKHLPKGLQQRVGFAYALLGDCPVLVLDEPLFGLDPVEESMTKGIIKNLCGDHIIIISSHVKKEIEELCSDVMTLKDGTLVLADSFMKVKRRYNVYDLSVKGDMEKLQECLKQCDLLMDVEYIGENEKGVHEFTVISKDTRDIGDRIFGYLAGKKFSVNNITKKGTVLEDELKKVDDKEDL